jgi:hypothetical protein
LGNQNPWYQFHIQKWELIIEVRISVRYACLPQAASMPLPAQSVSANAG